MKTKKTRVLALLMAVVMVMVALPLFSVSAENETVVTVLCGDATGDGVVNMKDVLNLRKFIAGLDEPVDWDAADANGDMDINMKDVLVVRKYLAGIGELGTRTYTVPAPTTTTAPTTVRTTKATQPLPENAREDYDPKSGIDYADPAINFIEGTNKSLGVWWWVPQYNENSIRSYMELFKKNQVTEIYYEAYSMLYGSSGSRSQLHYFVSLAEEYGMRVAALYDDQGSITGGGPFNRCVDGFLQYKSEYPDDALYALHCDVEPRNSVSQLSSYISKFIPQVAAARAKGVPVELDIACGWESNGRDLEYNGVTGIYNILAANCDCLCMMSYRDKYADIYGCGTNIIPAAKQYGTKVVFGIELGNSGEGDHVDFHEEGIYTAWSELYKLNQKVDNRELENDFPVGYAIHSESTMKALRLHWGDYLN